MKRFSYFTAIAPGYEEVLAEIISKKMSMDLDKKAFTGIDEDDVEEKKPYDVVDGLAIYSVRGPMLAEESWYTGFMNIPTYSGLRSVFAQMAGDEEVKQVYLSVSTPGGLVSGIADASQALDDLNKEKPVTVHTHGMLASAGVWLFSGANRIYASETAEIGSIGVKIDHFSYEKRLAEDGVKFTEIKSAEKKAIGGPFKDLSNNDEAHLKEKVLETAGLFKKRVYRSRPNVDEAVFTGEMFKASTAMNYGLIDGVKTFKDVFKELLMTVNKDSGAGVTYTGGYEMKKKVTAEVYKAAVESGADPDSMEIIEKVTEKQEPVDSIKDASETADDASETADDASETAEDASETAEGSSEELEKLKEELAKASQKAEEAAARISALEEQVNALESDPLREIVIERIGVMRVALSLQPVDMSKFPTQSLVTEYKALHENFTKQFKAGGVAQKVESKKEAKKAAITSLEKARLRAVGIK